MAKRRIERTCRHAALVALVLTALSGCDFAAQVAEFNEIRTAIERDLTRQLGVTPMVEFTLTNGELAHVHIQFPVEQVGHLRARELANKSRSAIRKAFGKLPQRLVVSTFSTH